MLSLMRPEWFIPVHGEFRHLVHHARLAEAVGVPSDHVCICVDGDVVTLGDDELEVERRAVPAGYQYVDGIIDDISPQGVLRDRRILAEEGVVVVFVTVDATTGEIVTGPEIVTRGWIYEAEAADLLEEAKDAVRDSIADAAAEGATDFETLRRHARRALGKFISARTRRRPAIIPVVSGGLTRRADPRLVELHRRPYRDRHRRRCRRRTSDLDPDGPSRCRRSGSTT